jgi:hypothetical protein
MNRCRKTHHRYARPARGHTSRCLFRSYAGKRGGARSRHILFDREPTRRKEAGPGGDDQRTLRAGERGAERLDDTPVRLAVGLESREVVDEGRVNDGIRPGCCTAEAFKVFKIASMHLRSGGEDSVGGSMRAGKTEHLMARINQLPHYGRTDKARRPGDEDTHIEILPLRVDAECLCR